MVYIDNGDNSAKISIANQAFDDFIIESVLDDRDGETLIEQLLAVSD